MYAFLDTSHTSLGQWTHYTSIKAIPPFIIQPSYLLSLLLLCLPCSFVLCLPCLYISSCLQQLKPGWSLSRLAGTANLRIVPFIRLAPTHNKTPLTRSLKSPLRTQCDWVVIAFEWVGMNTLIYFLLLPSFCRVFFSTSSDKCDCGAIFGWMLTLPVKWTMDKQHCQKNDVWMNKVRQSDKCIKREFQCFPPLCLCLFLSEHQSLCVLLDCCEA